jgi:ATP-dependent DNA helicase DinG
MSATPEIAQALSAAVNQLNGKSRSGQLEMAQAITACVNKAANLLVEAGTGTGKSLAYLVPAFLHAANGVDDDGAGRTVIATATLALQRQLLENDAPAAARALAPLLNRTPSFAVYKGRYNYLCQARLGATPEAHDDDQEALFSSPTSALGKQVKALTKWAKSTQSGDRDEIDFDLDARVWRSFAVTGRECVGAAKCDFGTQCFAENARLEAHNSDIVITNHALLALDIQEDLHILPEHDLVIIDEAHELIDRTTGALSGSLDAKELERTAGLLRKFVSAPVHERFMECADDLAGALSSLTGENLRIQELDPRLFNSLTLVRDATRAAEKEMSAPPTEPDDQLAHTRAKAALGQCSDAALALLDSNVETVRWFSDARTPSLHYAPLSVAGFLAERLFDERTCVLTSATLRVGGQLDSAAKLLGLERSSRPWEGLDVGSPFQYDKQGILYCPAHLAAPNRDGVDESALDELAELLIAAGGRTLALFSSWRGVERASEYLELRLRQYPDLPLIVAKRGDSVSALVESFKATPQASLLGTVSLWQGIDVPGDTCTLVVIDRIPFPRPDDPITAARSARAEEQGGSGFAQVSLPKAALLLAQGVGRLIRSESDRGVVAVLDSRLANARYGQQLRASLPNLWWTTNRETVLKSLTNLDERSKQ